MTITVYGMPGPQGSKKFMGIKGGRGILVESSSKVKSWREAVKWAAIDSQVGKLPSFDRHVYGPVRMEVTFTMPRPKSAKKNAVPSTRPDLSKLVRSTEDALTDVGAFEDDARIVECLSRKVYPGQHKDSLGVPGAVIRIKRIDEQ
jgi:Holliday junction resolvase RusA-like endonuclease